MKLVTLFILILAVARPALGFYCAEESVAAWQVLEIHDAKAPYYPDQSAWYSAPICPRFIVQGHGWVDFKGQPVADSERAIHLAAAVTGSIQTAKFLQGLYSSSSKSFNRARIILSERAKSEALSPAMIQEVIRQNRFDLDAESINSLEQLKRLAEQRDLVVSEFGPLADWLSPLNQFFRTGNKEAFNDARVTAVQFAWAVSEAFSFAENSYSELWRNAITFTPLFPFPMKHERSSPPAYWVPHPEIWSSSVWAPEPVHYGGESPEQRALERAKRVSDFFANIRDLIKESDAADSLIAELVAPDDSLRKALSLAGRDLVTAPKTWTDWDDLLAGSKLPLADSAHRAQVGLQALVRYQLRLNGTYGIFAYFESESMLKFMNSAISGQGDIKQLGATATKAHKAWRAQLEFDNVRVTAAAATSKP